MTSKHRKTIDRLEVFAVLCRAIYGRGPEQLAACEDLERRGVELSPEQRTRAGFPVSIRLNGTEISLATILRTREHFAQVSRDCIREVETGSQPANNPEAYILWEASKIKSVLAGDWDRSLTFAQCALWIQTGHCAPMFSRGTT